MFTFQQFLQFYSHRIFTVHRNVPVFCPASPLTSGHGLIPAEVPLSGRAGVPDHLPGAHYAILPHPAGRGPAVPGLLSCGGGRGHEDPHLCAARLQGAQ